MTTGFASPRFSSRRVWGFGVAGLLLAGFGAVVGACVGDDPVLPSADAGGAAEGGGADTSTPADKCADYCATVNANCTGQNRQYRDDAECKRVCALLETGADNDRTQNTVSCRLANAKLGQTRELCANAGAWGGDVCGKRCENFCTVNAASCGTLGGSAPYASKADCLERACPVLRFDPDAGDGTEQEFFGGDTLNCRAYHLILALDNALTTHCPHTALVSDTCKVQDAGAD